ncbi:MAG TPA: fatty acyl-AMP ligase [Alphaproteobacteria bacterium]|nr:fatty acyl-AMP ligase [Alphaproteobacteria bacterium]
MTPNRTALATAPLHNPEIEQRVLVERPRLLRPTPSRNARLRQRVGEFSSLTEALDYAANGETGYNFYSGRGELIESLPYWELRSRSVIAARRLASLGFDRSDRVALLAETTPEFLTLFFACQYAGLIPVPLPLPTGLGARQGYLQQLRRQIAGAGARAAFASPEMTGYLNAAAEGLGLIQIGTPEGLEDVPESLTAIRPLGADDLSYLQYSSGSTRFPLGVAVSMRSLMNNAGHNVRSGLKVGPQDRSVSWLPLYHDMGLVGFVVSPLVAQASVDLLPSQEFARRPLVWLELLSRNRSTVSYSPSFGYEICVRRAERVTDLCLDLSSWRAAGIGGDMIRSDVLERFSQTFEAHGFRRTAFVASYGLAENTLAVSFAPLGRGIETDRVDRRRLAEENVAAPSAELAGCRDFAICGTPLPEHKLEIRAEDGGALPDRRVGRIFIKGPSLTAGYFNQPEATRQIITEDGWLDTGDMGYTIDGSVVITGRSKDLIIVNGRNIWPQDIEWAVEQLSGLRSGDVAAFSVEDGGSGEAVVVLMQCRTADPVEIEALLREVKGVVVQAAAVDCEVIPVPPRSLPQTSSGKLSRSKAKENYLAGRYRPAAAESIAAE